MLESNSSAKTNIKLISSDQKGFQLLSSGGTSDYDVLISDNSWVAKNAQAGHLLPLKKSDFPSQENWVEQYKWPFNPFVSEDKQYGVPSRWGWDSIGYNSEKVDSTDLDSYEFAWTGGPNGKYEGKIIVGGDPTWYIPMVAMELGIKPYKKMSQDELDQIKDKLIKTFNNAYSIHTSSAPVRKELLSGDAWIQVGLGNFGLSQLAAQGHEKFKGAIPKTGGIYWTEGMSLVKDPHNANLAKQYMQTVLSPEGQYKVCYGGATKGIPVNKNAWSKFSAEEQKAAMFYQGKDFSASQEVLDKCVQYEIPPSYQEWNKIWEEAKARASV
ncbi:putrescine ABC transporter, periplasmic putrescine-binding protein [Halarchaeum acidiphilum MH1-52-1]|uniref:Putrescine ABC transporter, periplasmic putrescine-binding protein n=2 Tax=Halarchaeum acidiphilum TaxID=489138 RepID=U2YSZ5_9EURY|nr:putrescine ABC transporter, periplasmic putrescine-binding protein [Halarchaeum acidiphilum MH1-52-1]